MTHKIRLHTGFDGIITIEQERSRLDITSEIGNTITCFPYNETEPFEFSISNGGYNYRLTKTFGKFVLDRQEWNRLYVEGSGQ